MTTIPSPDVLGVMLGRSEGDPNRLHAMLKNYADTLREREEIDDELNPGTLEIIQEYLASTKAMQAKCLHFEVLAGECQTCGKAMP